LAAYWGLNAMRGMLPYESMPHEAAIRLKNYEPQFAPLAEPEAMQSGDSGVV
jgi:hypothetical protein